MDKSNQLKELLKKGAEQINISINDKQAEQFMLYKDLIKQWNKKINLTAIDEDNDIITKHFLDSLTVLPYIKGKETEIIDVGTGAGFPGIVIRIMEVCSKTILLDSLKKRVIFLNEVVNALKLNNISVVHGRAEDVGKDISYREKFDYSIARAVASLPILLEYCMPFIKVNGVFIAMKGRNTEEISISKKALKILGGEIEDIKDLALPFTDIKRKIIIVKKLRQTSTKYPRKAGKPSKYPLK